MLSRRSKVQEKKAARKGVFFLFISIILLGGFFIYGLSLLANFVGLIDNLKNSSTPIQPNDKTPPAPPQFTESLQPFTTDKKFSAKVRAEAGSTVSVYFNDTKIKEIVVGENSLFTLELNLFEGENKIKFAATDQAGNTNDFNDTYKIVYDPTPPTLEVSKPQNGESFLGENKYIMIEGATDKDNQVTINDRFAIVTSAGKFSFKIKLETGENILTVIAIDKAENKTEKKITVSYTP